jgi:hypothetical protein
MSLQIWCVPKYQVVIRMALSRASLHSAQVVTAGW